MECKVAVLLVNYNGERYISQCVESIRAQSYKNFDIILVDNHSTDKSIDIIMNQYHDVKLIRRYKNEGFAFGNNVGIRYAIQNGYDYILLLNVDTEVDKKLIEVLLKYASNDTAVIPIIYSDRTHNNVCYAGGYLDLITGLADGAYLRHANKISDVTFMSGCCMLIHKNIWHKIGDFDEKYFLYYEDVDLCLRMTNHHVKMLYVPETWVYHKVGFRGMRKHEVYYMMRNQLYFMKKFKKQIKLSLTKTIYKAIKEKVIFANIYYYPFRKYVILGIWDFILKKMDCKQFI